MPKIENKRVGWPEIADELDAVCEGERLPLNYQIGRAIDAAAKHVQRWRTKAEIKVTLVLTAGTEKGRIEIETFVESKKKAPKTPRMEAFFDDRNDCLTFEDPEQIPLPFTKPQPVAATTKGEPS